MASIILDKKGIEPIGLFSLILSLSSMSVGFAQKILKWALNDMQDPPSPLPKPSN